MSLENYDNRKYVIFDYTEINSVGFSQVMETASTTTRMSVNGVKTLVKYDGAMPSSIAGLTSKSQEYTHSEILVILATPEWSLDPVTPA